MARRLLSILTFSILFISCRVNNGDIGNLFGSWSMYSMTVDGMTPEGFDPDTTFWEFQNNIVCISYVGFMYDKESRWGTWSDENDELLLNFTHSSHGMPAGTGQYRSPEWLGFPPNSVIRLNYISCSSKNMELSWRNEAGETLIYSLRKIW